MHTMQSADKKSDNLEFDSELKLATFSELVFEWNRLVIPTQSRGWNVGDMCV